MTDEDGGVVGPDEGDDWSFPVDERDGWEPGAPNLRALAPSAVGGAAIPVAVYFLVRPHVHSDAPALAIAGIPACLWVAFEWVRKRAVDPIGVIVLTGFAIGLLVSWLLGGNAFVLKVRDSAFTACFGVICLLSLRAERPMMFHIGKAMSAGVDPVKRDLYDRLWEATPSRAVFRILTTVWGLGLLVDAGVRVLVAAVLPTSVFVIVNPLLSACFLGGLFAFTMWFSRWARTRAESAMVLDVPVDGGSAWWWLRHFSPWAPAAVAEATGDRPAG